MNHNFLVLNRTHIYLQSTIPSIMFQLYHAKNFLCQNLTLLVDYKKEKRL